MFDDPKKELDRLQEQLLAADKEPEDDLEDDDEIADEEIFSFDGHDPECNSDEPPYDEIEEPEPPRRQPEQKSRSVLWLLFAAILELIALVLIALWWFTWRK